MTTDPLQQLPNRDGLPNAPRVGRVGWVVVGLATFSNDLDAHWDGEIHERREDAEAEIANAAKRNMTYGLARLEVIE